MVLKPFTTFIVVAAISASPKHRASTWCYRSSIYRVHWYSYNEAVLVKSYIKYITAVHDYVILCRSYYVGHGMIVHNTVMKYDQSIIS